jgi:protein farnesyltransferase subunit beta
LRSHLIFLTFFKLIIRRSRNWGAKINMVQDWLHSDRTVTCKAQVEVEVLLRNFLEDNCEPSFLRNKHSSFVLKNIGNLPQNIQGLHCSQPWLVYWTLQASDLLGITPQLFQQVPADAIVAFLMKCFTTEVLKSSGASYDERSSLGGFSGGPEQLPHLATTYAAVMSLCILASASSQPSFITNLDVAAIDAWFVSLRTDDGGYAMHRGGECDVRASYCVAVVASVLPLPSKDLLLGEQSGKFVLSCQTLEGGLSCSPVSTEAHGGYTQCGLAALLLMQQFHLLDATSMAQWLANRQFEYEGGFNGRINKLADSCYSHWIGSSHVMLSAGLSLRRSSASDDPMSAEDVYLLDLTQLMDATTLHIPKVPEMMKIFDDVAYRRSKEAAATEKILGLWSNISADDAGNGPENDDNYSGSSSSFADIEHLDEEVGDYLFNQRKLQDFVLRCCQNHNGGGLMDKPEHPNDFYHTCYAMSGVSSSQNLQYLYHVRQHAAGCSSSEEAPTVAGGVKTSSYVSCSLNRNWAPIRPGDSNSGAVLSIDETLSSLGAVKLALLRPTNPIFNITKERLMYALRHSLGKSSL